MKYVRVEWKHERPGYPIVLYSELDDARWEVRKVEVFLDGRRGYASADASSGTTELGLAPIPELAEIAQDPQFDVTAITEEEFNEAWTRRESRWSRNQ
jgi:hypothetical protein